MMILLHPTIIHDGSENKLIINVKIMVVKGRRGTQRHKQIKSKMTIYIVTVEHLMMP